MKLKVKKVLIALLIIAAAIGLFILVRGNKSKAKLTEVEPQVMDMKAVISITGGVEPMNRLEIKPPVSGRIESVPVREGDYVKEGQVVAYLSSTERAALIDMAKSKGDAEVKKWKELYKPIPVTAPISGTVIVRKIESGQSVGSSDAIIVLSDKLVVKAQADETDIRKIKNGQKAIVALDAYPDEQINCRVSHISYESQVVNNVTVYEVLIVPDRVPEYFRSGMSANVDIIEKEVKGAVALPVNAVQAGKRGSFVMVRGEEGPKRARVTTGISEGGFIEIESGISSSDKVLTISAQTLKNNKKKNNSSSPFMPNRPRRR